MCYYYALYESNDSKSMLLNTFFVICYAAPDDEKFQPAAGRTNVSQQSSNHLPLFMVTDADTVNVER